MIDAKIVVAIHDLILSQEPGLRGNCGPGSLEGTLARIDSWIHYDGLDDVFEIAAMYAVALARGHVFNDANKRTALVTALTYLSLQKIDIPRNKVLEDIMVDVAEGNLDQQDLSEILYSLARSESEHANCSECQTASAVVNLINGKWRCDCCHAQFNNNELERCEYCDELTTAHIKDSFFLGCGFCQGDSARHRDD